MAGTRCTVCDHPERTAIEAALPVSSVRNIAKQWALSPAAVHRHRTSHVQAAVARVAATRTELSAQALLDRLGDLLTRCDDGMESATKTGDYKAVAGFIRESRELVVTLGRAAHGLWTQKPSVIDQRHQSLTIEVGKLTVEELRNLARLAPGGPDAIEAEFHEPRALAAAPVEPC
jgi:hypothetical protein